MPVLGQPGTPGCGLPAICFEPEAKAEQRAQTTRTAPRPRTRFPGSRRIDDVRRRGIATRPPRPCCYPKGARSVSGFHPFWRGEAGGLVAGQKQNRGDATLPWPSVPEYPPNGASVCAEALAFRPRESRLEGGSFSVVAAELDLQRFVARVARGIALGSQLMALAREQVRAVRRGSARAGRSADLDRARAFGDKDLSQTRDDVGRLR